MTTQPAQPAVPAHPARLSIDDPPVRKPLLPLVRLFWGLIIAGVPHGIVLYLYGIAAWVAWIFAFLAMLVTGKYPKSLFDFSVGYFRWQWRLASYLMLKTDKYPPFSNQP